MTDLSSNPLYYESLVTRADLYIVQHNVFYSKFLCFFFFFLNFLREKVNIPPFKSFITVEGEGADNTVIQHGDTAQTIGPNGKPLGTFGSATFAVNSPYFQAKNITFKVPNIIYFQFTLCWCLFKKYKVEIQQSIYVLSLSHVHLNNNCVHYHQRMWCIGWVGVVPSLIRGLGFESGYRKILGRERYPLNGTLPDANPD